MPPEAFVSNLHKQIAKFEADKARCEPMVELVERMLESNKKRDDVAPTFRSAGAKGAHLKVDASGDGEHSPPLQEQGQLDTPKRGG